jgi:hypothetical protein
VIAARSLAGVALIAMALTACRGAPPDLGTIEPREPIAGQTGSWQLIRSDGVVPSADPVVPLAVEVDADGRTMTVFFQGGNPECYGLAGATVIRNDPETPDVELRYGMRLGVLGCDAALYNLATRVELVPPIEDG